MVVRIGRRSVAVVFAARLALAPFAFADDPAPRPGPLRAAAAREAMRPSGAGARGAMPGGLKWTGIGLLTAGAALVPVAGLGDCTPSEFACRDQRAAAYVAGGLLAGTGALLLVIGHGTRRAALPSVTVDQGRTLIAHRVTF